MPLFGLPTAIELPPSALFDAQAYLGEGQSHFWSFTTFRTLVLEGVTSSVPKGLSAQSLPITTTKKEVGDDEIEAALPSSHLFELAEVSYLLAKLMKQQRAGEEGLLADDNLFYTANCVARVLRFSHATRWTLSAWPRGHIAWRAGDRVWIPR
jgi:hypothetical protein